MSCRGQSEASKYAKRVAAHIVLDGMYILLSLFAHTKSHSLFTYSDILLASEREIPWVRLVALFIVHNNEEGALLALVQHFVAADRNLVDDTTLCQCS